MRRQQLLQRLGAFRGNPDGSVAVIVGISMVALIGSAAMSIDVGTFFLVKRTQQAATDIAAVMASEQIANATQAVATALTSNGIGPSKQVSLAYGIYSPDSLIAPAQRFQAAPQSTADSVRVSIVGTVPLYFGAVLSFLSDPASGAPREITIRTTATASQANFAAFAIGARLASLNGGVANAILGKLLGTQMSLSIMDYEALASAQIDIFAFSRALATRLNSTALTYGQLTSSSVHLGDLFAAIRDGAVAAGGGGASTAALAAIAQAKAGSGDVVGLAPLVDFGPFAPSQISVDAPLDARVSALDLLTAVAQVAGRGQLFSIDLTSSVPGLADVQVLLAIGDRPVGTSFVRVGRVGARVHTAQARLLLTSRLTALPPLLGLRTSIFLQLASVSASLSTLACGPGPGSPSVTLDVLPSLVDASIGSVSPHDLADFGATPRVAPTPIASVLGLAAIDGSAHVTSAGTAPTRLVFSAADIEGRTKRTASSSKLVSGLTQSLVSNLQVSVEPIGATAPAVVTQAVGLGLSAAAPLLDPLLSSIMTTLGLRVGEADAWVSGVKCSGGVLVN